MRTVLHRRTPHGNVMLWDSGDLGDGRTLYIRARSERHAHRLAGLLGWHSFDGAPGQPFGRLHYSQRRKRLSFQLGRDC